MRHALSLTAVLTSMTIWLEELQHAQETADWAAVAHVITNLAQARNIIASILAEDDPLLKKEQDSTSCRRPPLTSLPTTPK